jgi:hypothetical protein
MRKAKNRSQRRTIILVLAKLGFNRLNPSDKVSLARHVILNMTDNPNFLNPVPSIPSVIAAANALHTTQAALDGSKLKTALRNTAEEALDKKMRQLQAYVISVADGDKGIILSSGMDLADERTKMALPGSPTSITLKLGMFEGSIDIRWKGFKRSRLYRVEMSTSPMQEDSWELAGTTTKQKITISKLKSGEVYFFRIICTTSAGDGPPSERHAIKVY